MLDYVLLVLVGVIALESIFAIKGIHLFITEKKFRRAVKNGLVRIVVFKRNGTVREEFISADEVAISKDGARILDPSAGKLPADDNTPEVVVDGKKYKLHPSRMWFDPKHKVRTWVFFEDNAFPIGMTDETIYMNSKYLQKVIMRAGQLYRSPIEKYFKITLAAISGLAGLILLLVGGGV